MTSKVELSEIKALIIDDQDPIRKAMKRVLLKMGVLDVTECFDGEEAIKELESRPEIDLVLCDIYMRKVDGFAVLSFIRSREIRSDIPVIVVTGEASKEDIVKASDLGADDYIIKPFQANQMEQKVLLHLNKFLSPGSALQQLRQGDRFLMANELDKAAACYQEVMDIDQANLRARHSFGVTQFKGGKIVDAIKTLNRNVTISESFYKNYATLADIYTKKRDYSNAILMLKKELSYNPKQPKRQNFIARLLLKQNNPSSAIAHYRETLKENGKDEVALLGMGYAFYDCDDINKALYYFKRMRRYYPHDSKPLRAALKICVAAGEFKKAEILLRDERKLHPERSDAHVLLAKFYISQDRLNDAHECVDVLYKLDPDHIDGKRVEAAILVKEKEYAKALSCLEHCSRAKPEFETYLAMAECEQRLELYKESILNLHHALRLNPNHPSALFLLAQAMKKTSQLTKASFLYKVAGKNGANPDKCKKNHAYCAQHVRKRRAPRQKIGA